MDTPAAEGGRPKRKAAAKAADSFREEDSVSRSGEEEEEEEVVPVKRVRHSHFLLHDSSFARNLMAKRAIAALDLEH